MRKKSETTFFPSVFSVHLMAANGIERVCMVICCFKRTFLLITVSILIGIINADCFDYEIYVWTLDYLQVILRSFINNLGADFMDQN
jgi:hypothetical protein